MSAAFAASSDSSNWLEASTAQAEALSNFPNNAGSISGLQQHDSDAAQYITYEMGRPSRRHILHPLVLHAVSIIAVLAIAFFVLHCFRDVRSRQPETLAKRRLAEADPDLSCQVSCDSPLVHADVSLAPQTQAHVSRLSVDDHLVTRRADESTGSTPIAASHGCQRRYNCYRACPALTLHPAALQYHRCRFPVGHIQWVHRPQPPIVRARGSCYPASFGTRPSCGVQGHGTD